jgi:hypothetical protein
LSQGNEIQYRLHDFGPVAFRNLFWAGNSNITWKVLSFDLLGPGRGIDGGTLDDMSDIWLINKLWKGYLLRTRVLLARFSLRGYIEIIRHYMRISS